MPTMLPTDANNQAIPALRLHSNGAHKISVTATSARNTIAFNGDTKIVSLYATVPVYLKCGNDSATATITDHYFPAGVYYDIAIASPDGQSYTHIAALRADTDGFLYISEKE